MPAKSKAHYAGTYQVRARQVRAAANANPATRCWRCGRTQAEHGRRWQAGHLIDGDPLSPLAAECQPCNGSAGATMGNLKRLGRLVQGTASRRW